MKEFHFVVIFDSHNPQIDLDFYSDALYEAGCSDGLFAVGKKGSIAIDFIRESESAYDAVFSAIKQVKSVIPQSDLVSIFPDIVGVKELAEIFECSKQNIQKYTYKESFPNAFYKRSSQSLWYLEAVLNWFKENSDLPVDSSLEEIANLTRIINLELNQKNKSSKIIKQAQQLVAI